MKWQDIVKGFWLPVAVVGAMLAAHYLDHPQDRKEGTKFETVANFFEGR